MTHEIYKACLYGTGVTLNGKHVPLEEFYIMPEPKELPLYTCHKKVRALEIRGIGHYSTDANDNLIREIVFADPAFLPIWAGEDLFKRYVPMPGDYYVVYEDGYASFSPRKAFLEGYALAVPENVLMERLMTLSQAKVGGEPPEWLQGMDWAQKMISVAREAYVTINSLKQHVAQLKAEVTLAWERVEEVKHEKADPDQS